MSAEGDVSNIPAAQIIHGQITIEEALREVLKKSLFTGGLSRGLREAVKTLDKGEAKLCVLSESCDEKEYTRLIEALCAEHKVSLVKIPDSKQLGEWVGLCKIDKNGNAQKVVSCSCVAVKVILFI